MTPNRRPYVVPCQPGRNAARNVLRILRAWTTDMETITGATYSGDGTYLTAGRAVARMRLRQIADLLNLDHPDT